MLILIGIRRCSLPKEAVPANIGCMYCLGSFPAEPIHQLNHRARLIQPSRGKRYSHYFRLSRPNLSLAKPLWRWWTYMENPKYPQSIAQSCVSSHHQNQNQDRATHVSHGESLLHMLVGIQVAKVINGCDQSSMVLNYQHPAKNGSRTQLRVSCLDFINNHFLIHHSLFSLICFRFLKTFWYWFPYKARVVVIWLDYCVVWWWEDQQCESHILTIIIRIMILWLEMTELVQRNKKLYSMIFGGT